MILSARPTIDVDDLPENLRLGRTKLPVDDLSLTLAEVERRHIERVLESTNGNQRAAARRLGLDRATLNRKLKHWNEPSLSEGYDEHSHRWAGPKHRDHHDQSA